MDAEVPSNEPTIDAAAPPEAEAEEAAAPAAEEAAAPAAEEAAAPAAEEAAAPAAEEAAAPADEPAAEPAADAPLPAAPEASGASAAPLPPSAGSDPFEAPLPGGSGGYSLPPDASEAPLPGGGYTLPPEAFAAPDAADGASEAPTGPLESRLADKNWKTRKGALEELIAELDGGGAVDLGAVAPALSKAAGDSNANCLCLGLEACAKAAASSGAALSAHAAEMCRGAVEKGFSGRPAAQEAASSLLLALFAESGEEVSGALLKGLESRKPKVPPLCASTLSRLCALHAPARLPVAAALRALPALLRNGKSAAREAGAELLAALGARVGLEPLEGVLSGLREAQRSEVEARVEALRAEGSCDEDVDAREFVEAVDLLGKLRESGFWAEVEEPKWSLKVKALEACDALIGRVPKLAEGDYAPLVKLLQALVGHAHFQVALHAIRLVARVCEGLRSSFSPFVPRSVRLMVQRLPEKKLLSSIQDALLAFDAHAALPLDAFKEELVHALSGNRRLSAVHARAAVLDAGRRLFLQRAFAAADADAAAQVAAAAASCVEDRDPKIRDAAIGLLSALRRWDAAFFDARVAPLLQSNARALKRVLGAGPGASASAGAGASASAGAGARTQRPPRRAPRAKEAEGPRARAPKAGRGPPRGGPPKAPPRGAPPKAPTPTPPSDPTPAVAPFALDAAGAEARLREFWPEDAEGVLSGAMLGSSKWQERKGGVDALAAALSRGPQAQSLAVFVGVAKSRTRGFKESNVNVLRAVLDGLCALCATADASSAEAQSAALCALDLCFAKVHDRKLGASAKACARGLAEAFHPRPVALALCEAAAGARPPLQRAEALSCLEDLVGAFGALVGAERVAAHAVLEAGHAHPKARAAALSLFGALHRRVGPKLRTLGGVEALEGPKKAALEKAMAAAPFDPSLPAPQAPRVALEGDARAAVLSSGRVELGGLLGKECLRDLSRTEGKNSWKARNAALDAVEAALERSGGRLERSRAVLEVAKGLRGRLSDTQANLRPRAARLLSRLSLCCDGPTALKVLRLSAEALCGGCGDAKRPFRAACREALAAMAASETSAAALIAPAAAALERSPGARPDLLAVLAPLMGRAGRRAEEDAERALAASLVACMMDKGAGVRKAAGDALCEALRHGCVAEDALERQTRDLSEALKRTLGETIRGVVERAREMGVGVGVGVETPLEGSGPSSRPEAAPKAPGKRAAAPKADPPGPQGPPKGPHPRPHPRPHPPRRRARCCAGAAGRRRRRRTSRCRRRSSRRRTRRRCAANGRRRCRPPPQRRSSPPAPRRWRASWAARGCCATATARRCGSTGRRCSSGSACASSGARARARWASCSSAIGAWWASSWPQDRRSRRARPPSSCAGCWRRADTRRSASAAL